VVPLIWHETIHGVIYVWRRGDPERFADDEVTRLEELARIAAMAIAFSHGYSDEQALQERLNVLLDVANLVDAPSTVDEILPALAHALRASVRADRIGREPAPRHRPDGSPGGRQVGPSLEFALEGLHLYGTTDSPDLAEMAMVCDLEEIFGGVAIPPREVTAGADTTHNGTAARTLEVEERTGDTYTMLVAAEGEPYPLYMRGEYRGDTMTLEFSDYGVPVEVEPPAQHLVIDISDM
jgi:hypothetical protein